MSAHTVPKYSPSTSKTRTIQSSGFKNVSLSRASTFTEINTVSFFIVISLNSDFHFGLDGYKWFNIVI